MQVDEGIDREGRRYVLIHYAYESPAGLRQVEGLALHPGRSDTWKIACMPNLEGLRALGRTHPYQVVNEVRAVTCPLCKASKPYQEAWKLLQILLG